MIRIQLIREGRVVKQITSRVHESVILEQVNKYDSDFDTIAILEGELSEDAKSILQKVAKKIIPAAMAAGVAMGGSQASAQSFPQNNYPGTNYSVGQHLGDIFNPQYKEIQRQRKYEQETRRREWDAQQGEIRRARINAAKEEGRRATGTTNNQKIYDQSRVSQDGKYFILYGMDDSITRIPTQGAEFMPADSQRMAHYISAGGRVYYVRHPHNKGLGESTVLEGRPGHEEFDKGYADAQRGVDSNPYNPNSPAYNQYREGQQAFKRHVGESTVAEGVAETLTMDEAKKVLRKYGADNFKTTSNELHFYKNGKAMSIDLITNDDATRSVKLSQLNSATRQLKGVNVKEDIGTIGTVGTIPANAGSMTKKTEFNKTGGTTDVKFNAQGQLELDDELDDDAIDTLKKAGVKVAEAGYRMHPELVKIINANKQAVEEFKDSGELSQDLESDLHYYYYDKLSLQAQQDADDDGEIAELFAEDLGIDLADLTQLGPNFSPKLGEAVTSDIKLNAILDQFPEAWADFKAGGDLDDNPDFYEALFAYYSELGPEDGMPYGTQKARDGDPVQWIADKLDKLSGVEPMGESQLNEYLLKGGMPAEDVLSLNVFQDLDPVEGLSAQYDDFAQDPTWQAVFKQYAPIANALKQRVLALKRPLTNAEANAIDDTWYDGSDAYDDVEAQYLADVYDNQIDKIEALLAGNLTDEEFGESVEDDEASPADVANADKNIIMQLRKAKDYEKPTVLELGDGATVRIDSGIAAKMLAQFDRLRPDSKLLMQQTLNTDEGFREMLNYFNEREVLESMADVDLISNHMKPVLEARQRARNLVKSVFGKV